MGLKLCGEPVRERSYNESKAYKLVIVGNTAVGKTALIRRYLLNEFSDDYVPTELVDSHLAAKNVGIHKLKR